MKPPPKPEILPDWCRPDGLHAMKIESGAGLLQNSASSITRLRCSRCGGHADAIDHYCRHCGAHFET